MNRVVGVHIRAYHTKYDWPVVVPISDTNVQRFDQVTPLDSYFNIIQSILSNYPNTKFFIASNNLQAKEHLIRIYGTKMIILKSDESLLGERSSNEGMIVAAAEFFLLGQTSYLIHARGSSFGKEAAAVHMIKLIDVSISPIEGQFLNLLNQDASLPYCGLQEYIRAVKVDNCDVDTIFLDSTSTSISFDATSTSFSIPTTKTPSVLNNDTNVIYESNTPKCTDQCKTIENCSKRIKNSISNKRVCYNEGDREMCTLEFKVCPCLGGETPVGYMQRMTGISDLLCNVDIDSYVENGEDCFLLLAESNGYSI
jgi:hypothetical protein